VTADPGFIKPGDRRGLENTDEAPKVWRGPDAATMLELALKQPGAKRRQHGVKFQCAGCVAEGHDKSMDNACVFNDGRFSCAHSGAPHRAAIAAQLNIPIVPVKQAPLATGKFVTGDPLDAPIRSEPPF
jgi:hypothetical protein